MLLGEYSIIHKSKALAIPFDRFYGGFNTKDSFATPEAKDSNQQLLSYADYLKQNLPPLHLKFKIDADAFLADVNNGLYFESNIPQGYGVGSSGALIANLYGKYAKVDDAKLIRDQLAWLENYFHGKSSGIDPLVAYLNKPLLFEDDGFVDVEQPFISKTGVSGLYLLDTQQMSKTAPLVNLYLSKVNNHTIDPKEYINLVNDAIDSLYSSDSNDFIDLIRKISAWQHNHLSEMIPSSVNELWENGLKENNWLLKLCGSGGGGFVYVYVVDIEAFMDVLDAYSLPVYRVF
jgi:mevalonate kinase